MKQLLKIFALIFLTSFVVSCDDDDEPNQNETYKATLSGANEATPNSSTATGTGTLTFNTITKIFTITVTHTIASPTAGHIHKGAVGISGPVVYPFSSLVSPITITSAALTTEQEADLTAGLFYVNLHSAAFPGGEIRGNLIKQ